MKSRLYFKKLVLLLVTASATFAFETGEPVGSRSLGGKRRGASPSSATIGASRTCTERPTPTPSSA